MLRTRFAPSPTGELHLGHVAHLLILESMAHRHQAEIVVRMEDHDRLRCRREFETSILSDLQWLGCNFRVDTLRPLQGRPPSPWRQSDHPERYQQALERLQEVARVYACTCTRSDLEPADGSGDRRHRDCCRQKNHPLATTSALRVELPDEWVSWEELGQGLQTENPWLRHGDTLLRNRRGEWSYQFCVVVDDIHDGVNLVVRGADLLSSTGRQVLLSRLLGAEQVPRYSHHPLLQGDAGGKLSKRRGSESLTALRRQGLSAAAVRALAGAQLARLGVVL